MKKLYIKVWDDFCCCTDCPLSKLNIDFVLLKEEYFCQHPKSAGKVTEYYNDQTGCHPECPLPNIPQNFNSLLYIEELITKDQIRDTQKTN